jgi:hypothetical protein
MRITLFLYALILLWGGAALAETPIGVPKDNKIEFEILRNGKNFGSHELKFTRQGPAMVVDIAINMKYTAGPLTLFRYEHSNQERWLGNRLLGIKTKTNDDGENYLVEATWDRERIEVRTKDKLYDAPAGVLSTSYWNKSMLKRDKVLNTQYGKIEPIKVTYKGQTKINVAGEQRLTDAYIVQADIPIEVWYDTKTKQWVGLKFTARGAPIEYRRLNPL